MRNNNRSAKMGNKVKTMYIIPPDLYNALLHNYVRRQKILSSPAINSMIELEEKMEALLQNSSLLTHEQKVEKYSQFLREFLEAQEKRWKEQEIKTGVNQPKPDQFLTRPLIPPFQLPLHSQKIHSLPPLSPIPTFPDGVIVQPSTSEQPSISAQKQQQQEQQTGSEVPFVPGRYQHKAKQILRAIDENPFINYSSSTGELRVRGNTIHGSNIQDLIRHAVIPQIGDYSRRAPFGMDAFIKGLADTNLGSSFITEPNFKTALEQERQRLSHQREAATSRKSGAAANSIAEEPSITETAFSLSSILSASPTKASSENQPEAVNDDSKKKKAKWINVETRTSPIKLRRERKTTQRYTPF